MRDWFDFNFSTHLRCLNDDKRLNAGWGMVAGVLRLQLLLLFFIANILLSVNGRLIVIVTVFPRGCASFPISSKIGSI